SKLINLKSTFYLNGQPIVTSLDDTLKHQNINEYENILKIKTAPNEDKVDGNFCSDAYSGHEAAILCINSNNNLLVTGGGDSTVRFWCDLTKTQKKIVKNHTGVIYSLISDDEHVFSGGSDGKIVIYNYKGEAIKEIQAHNKGVICLQLMDKLIISGGRDNYVKVFKSNGECAFNYSHNKPITCMATSDEYIYSGSRDGKVKAFKNFTHHKELSHPASVNCLAVHREYLIVGCENGMVYCYNNFSLAKTLNLCQPVMSLSISKNGMFFCTGSFNRKVQIYCLENQNMIGEYSHTAAVYKVYCGSDKVVSCGRDGCLMVYDLGLKTVKSRFFCGDELYDFAIYKKGVVCGGKDRKLYFLG
ncbi:hypothetical protein H311_01214, partial [Anncaliia algerae PRA109]